MVEPERPDPDKLLASIRKEEAKAGRGKLKIFFGMSPGVGKTYAMLEAARQRKKEGVDVVVGVVETHSRADTQALLEGLAVQPRRAIDYRGASLQEMDLDALLARHPQLALVDELAHTNAPGCRHPKRYQDVLELLDAGIDVYSTLNVQHLETASATVHQITGIAVRETVPDSVLESATSIELVDLTPEQLRQRLSEGKVYLGDRAAAAADNFFRESNLTALREMALRITAEQVNQDLREIMQAGRIPGPWKSADRLMVAVGPTPFSENLIRWTRRAAATLNATWLAVTVETPSQLDEESAARLARNLSLARQLGAEVITTSGGDVADALIRVARQQNVTQIIMGKTRAPLWRRVFDLSVADRLIRNSGDIDVHLVRLDAAKRQRTAFISRPWPLRAYAQALGIVSVVTIFNLVIERWTSYEAVALVYLLAVVLSVYRLGRGPVLALASLSALLWNFLFIPPRFTFFISSAHDWLMFLMMFVVAIVLGHVTARMREREQLERRQEERATALYELTRSMALSADLQSALQQAVRRVNRFFDAESAVVLTDAADAGTFVLTEKERSVARWAMDHRQPAGCFTDTLPDAEGLHLPLISGGKSVGVLSIKPHRRRPWSVAQRDMLDSFAALITVMLEKEAATRSAAREQLRADSERLQTALFDSVSHELKTPLSVISSAAEQLTEVPLVREIRMAVTRLRRVVDQLLDMTRLNSGLVRPNFEWCDVGDLLSTTILEMGNRLSGHRVTVDVEEGLAPARLDFQLIKQALENLLNNAVAYSPPETEIRVSAHVDDGDLVIAVADQGRGLRSGELDRVFDKFYRGADARPDGMGLGLSIVKRLAEAHDGLVTAENRPGGGAVFTLRLPMGEAAEIPHE